MQRWFRSSGKEGARLQSGAGELLPCDLSTGTYQYATLKILKGLLKNLLLVKGLLFLPPPHQALLSPSREKSCQQPNACERILVIAVRFCACKDKYICHKAQRKHNRMWANIKLAETHNQLSRTLSFTDGDYYAMGLSHQQPQEQRLRPSV